MRYRLWGSYSDSKPDLSFRLSALFGIVSLRAAVDEDIKPEAGIYLCGLRVKDLLAKHKDEGLKEAAGEETGATAELSEQAETKAEDHREPGSKQGRDIRDKLRLLLDILRDPSCQSDISRIKKWALGILRRVTPKIGSVRAAVGLSDPAATAKVCEIYVCLMPILGEHVELIPDFTSEIMDADGDIRGRFGLIPVLYLSIRIFILGARIWKKTQKRRSASAKTALAST